MKDQINIKITEDQIREATDDEIEQTIKKIGKYIKEIKDKTSKKNVVDISEVDGLLYQQLEKLEKESKRNPDIIIECSREMAEIAKVLKTPVHRKACITAEKKKEHHKDKNRLSRQIAKHFQERILKPF